MSSQPDDTAGSAAKAEDGELQGYGNDTGFAEEAEAADEDGRDAAAPSD
ncbi:hypothetical protein GTR02_02340 [Kineococcus sp. R8]|nr:hypothetical protein [Kineococcus siccus]NAZ80656.1 hypothetical protein [Kineococcus siccus]